MIKKTKIVATLGPASDNKEVLRGMIKEGMNVARMNFSHGSHEEHKERLNRFRAVCDEEGALLPVLLDTKGPEIRTGEIDGVVKLKTGKSFVIYHDDVKGDEKGCSVSYKQLHEDVKKGDAILFDDGLVKLLVEEIKNKDIVCKIQNDGQVSTKKSVNVPGVSVNLPPLTEKDIADLRFACENDFDFVALSFVRKATDVTKARDILKKYGGEDIRIIAKIENHEGVDNIDDIIMAADGIMIARGDLGVEIPYEEVPFVQHDLIKKSYMKGKAVITATQMLDSMIRNPRPTRAEVADIATAIVEGTSAIMLSGETAMGKYPVESVKTMANVAKQTERTINYWQKLKWFNPEKIPMSVTDSISFATCSTAMNTGAKAIITVTSSGKTARVISRFKPNCPVIAITPSEKVRRQLQLSFGVVPVLSTQQSSTDELIADAIGKSLETGLVEPGDTTVITAGLPIGTSGTTNLLKVQIVGDIACHGLGVGSGIVTGRICIVSSVEDALEKCEDGDVLVAKYTIHDMLPAIKRCAALVVEDGDINGHAAISAMALEKPIILGVDNACKLLENGAKVNLDLDRGTIQYTQF